MLIKFLLAFSKNSLTFQRKMSPRIEAPKWQPNPLTVQSFGNVLLITFHFCLTKFDKFDETSP